MRPVRRVVAAAALAFSFTISGIALAQPTAADKETARSLMDDGDHKRDAGDMKGALKSYEGADAIMKVPSTAVEVAKTQIALGMLLEARETLNRIQRIPSKPNEPPPFVSARKTAASLNDDLDKRIPSVQISITNIDPSQTPQVVVDGEPVPRAAAEAPRKMNPGKHTIIVRAGNLEKREEITLAERDTQTVTVDLSKGSKRTAKEKPTKHETSEPDKSEGSSTGKYLMYGGFGVAILGVGVGAITGIMSISKTNDLKAVCKNNECPVGKQADIDSATGLGNLSTVAFVIGGVGAAIGVIGIIIGSGDSKEPKKESSPTARLLVGPSSVGLGGTF